MKCIIVTGVDEKKRKQCINFLGKVFSGSEKKITCLSPWNRTHDIDPFHSSPFAETFLICPEAFLFYRKPGIEISEIFDNLGSDWIIADNMTEISAPEISCDKKSISSSTIAVFNYTGDLPFGISSLNESDNLPGTVDYLENRVFELLPQLSEEQCGLCGIDCARMNTAIIAGERTRNNCQIISGKIRIFDDGKQVPLGKFPGEIIRSTIIGLLSPLKGLAGTGKIVIELSGRDT